MFAKQKLALMLLMLVMMFLLASCSGVAESPVRYVSPTYSSLPDSDSNAGGYWAEVRRDFNSDQTDDQFYNWTPFDVWLPGDLCVTVGSLTHSIELKSRYDYKWVKGESNPHDYCLVHR